MNEERMLAQGLHELADAHHAGPPPLEALLRRGRRSRYVRATGAATATLAAGAVVTASVTGLPGAGADHSGGARGSLALAAEQTAQTTFHYTMTETLRDDSHVVRFEGAYDPINQRGTLNVFQPLPRGGPPQLSWEERLLGGQCFQRAVYPTSSGPWQLTQSRCGVAPGVAPGVGLSASRGNLLDALKSAGSTNYLGRTGNGENAIDSWSFRVDVEGTQDTSIVSVTGTVTVIVSTGLIREVVGRAVTPFPAGHGVEVDTDTVLSDYGSAVVVTPPSGYETLPSPAPTPRTPPSQGPSSAPSPSS